MLRMTISLEPQTHELLRRLAFATHKSMAEIIREAISLYAQGSKKRVVYYENPERADERQAVWLRRPGDPPPTLEDGADYFLPGAPIRSEESARRWFEEEFREEFHDEFGGAVCI